MFDKIKEHLVALETAVSAGDVPGSLHAFGDVSHDAGDLAGLFFTSPPVKGAAGSDPVAQECIDCCERIKAACAKPVAKAGAKPGTVGAWGDGTFLKAFLAALPALIDAIADLFKKA